MVLKEICIHIDEEKVSQNVEPIPYIFMQGMLVDMKEV